jgi:hypothetical protein
MLAARALASYEPADVPAASSVPPAVRQPALAQPAGGTSLPATDGLEWVSQWIDGHYITADDWGQL